MDPAYVATHVEEDRRHWWFRGRLAVLLATLRRVLPPGRLQLLELGCGTGNVLASLAEFGVAVGMEAHPELAAAARAAGLDVRPGRLPEDLVVEPGWADAVLLLDVLEHLDDDVAALVTACRAVGCGGRDSAGLRDLRAGGRGSHRLARARPAAARVGPREPPRACGGLRRRPRARRPPRDPRALVVLSAARPLRGRARVPARTVRRRRGSVRHPGLPRAGRGRGLPAGAPLRRGGGRRRGGAGIHHRPLRRLLVPALSARPPARGDGRAAPRRAAPDRDLRAPRLVRRGRAGPGARPADQAPVRRLRAGAARVGRGTDPIAPRAREPRAGRADRWRPRPALVRPAASRPGTRDREPLVPTGGGVGPPRAAHWSGAHALSALVPDPVRAPRRPPPHPRARRRRPTAPLAPGRVGPARVRALRASPKQESALHPSPPAGRRRPRGRRLRRASDACAGRRARAAGCRRAGPGERDGVRRPACLGSSARRALRGGDAPGACGLAPARDSRPSG